MTAPFLPRTFIILGPHRSGTSFMAKSLMDGGVKMVARPPHYEDGEFVRLNRAILEDAGGGDWKYPPSTEALELAGEAHADEIQALIQKRKGPMWGWKDPRQALTLRSYLPFLEEDVYLVCMFRRPELVGASLRRLRQTEDGESLARTYQRRILDAVEEWLGL